MTRGRPAALAAVVLAWLLLVWAVGPAGLLVVALLAVPRVGPRLRAWLRPRTRPSWRGLTVVAAVVAAVVAGVLLAPAGLLPLPPGAGPLVTPSYVGRAASPDPLSLGGEIRPGPIGDSPEVSSRWYGGEDCGDLAFLDDPSWILAVCAHGAADAERRLRLVDPGTLRPLATRDLEPAAPEGAERPGCARAFAPTEDDRVVVATAARTLEVVATSDAAGEPDLTLAASIDLTGEVAADDCLVAVATSGRRLWWASADGLLGVVEPGGVVRTVSLPGGVADPLTVADGVAYVLTTEALFAVGTDAAGRLQTRWRAVYDAGSTALEDQPSGGGAAPALLRGEGGGTTATLVAITDDAEPRAHVRVHRVADGALVCQEPVFDDDASAVGSTPVVVGDAGVVVQNSAGWSGPSSTLLGRAPAGGMARVDVVDGECVTTWTADVVAPSARATVSAVTGLVYAWTTRHSWWGVSAWSLTGLEARTGRVRFAARAGLGTPWSPRRGGVALGPGGAAYVSTVGGLARLGDRIPAD